jgi:kynurenine formamidase
MTAVPTADLSNWGRWGRADERGTLNLMTPDKVVEAARLIRTGHIYRLAIPIALKHSSPLRAGCFHCTSLRKDATASRRTVALDVITMDTHNFTHMDSLAHVGYGERFYNDVPTDAVTFDGAQKNSIDNVTAIAGRAVLLDIPRALGVERLEAGRAIGPGDLDRAVAHAGVAVRPGNILLVRTGWIRDYLADANVARKGSPGLGEATVAWLRERDVCAVCADNPAVEVLPPERPDRSLILHEQFIRDLGGYLVEFLDLEEIAAAGVREGFFVMAPLRIVGGLGSPVTPLLMV